MAYTATWDASTNNNPLDTLAVYKIPETIRDEKHNIRERVEAEHKFEFDDNSAQGTHKQGSARVWMTNTEPSPATPVFGTKDTSDTKLGRIWVVTDNSTPPVPSGVIKIHNGTSWTPIPVVGPLPANVPTATLGDDVATRLTNTGQVVYCDKYVTNIPDAALAEADRQAWVAVLTGGSSASGSRIYWAISPTSHLVYLGYGSGSTITWRTVNDIGSYTPGDHVIAEAGAKQVLGAETRSVVWQYILRKRGRVRFRTWVQNFQTTGSAGSTTAEIVVAASTFATHTNTADGTTTYYTDDTTSELPAGTIIQLYRTVTGRAGTVNLQIACSEEGYHYTTGVTQFKCFTPGTRKMFYLPSASTSSPSYTGVSNTFACTRSGIISSSFDLASSSAGVTVTAVIYKNGSAFGTVRSTTSASPTTLTEDLRVDQGDYIQLFAYTSDVNYPALVTNYYLAVANTDL